MSSSIGFNILFNCVNVKNIIWVDGGAGNIAYHNPGVELDYVIWNADGEQENTAPGWTANSPDNTAFTVTGWGEGIWTTFPATKGSVVVGLNGGANTAAEQAQAKASSMKPLKSRWAMCPSGKTSTPLFCLMIKAGKDVIDMYGLAQYLRFDCGAFLRDKVLTVTSCGPLKDFETKQVTGSKVVVVVTKDETPYKPKADGTAITNLFEKITVKLPGKMGLNIPVGSVVKLINPTGTVYGEYRNQLSITADDVKVISAPKG